MIQRVVILGGIALFTCAAFGSAIACSNVLARIQGTAFAERIRETLRTRGDWQDQMWGLHPMNQHVWWMLLRANDLPDVARDARKWLKFWAAATLAAFLAFIAAMTWVSEH